jgi:hypothetical protein
MRGLVSEIFGEGECTDEVLCYDEFDEAGGERSIFRL